MKSRLAICLSLLLLWAFPAFSAEADEAACVAARNEDCVLAFLLEAAGRQTDVELLAASFAVVGKAYGMAGRMEDAAHYFDRAREVAEASPDPKVRDKALIAVSAWQRAGGVAAEALKLLDAVTPGPARDEALVFFVWSTADQEKFEVARAAARRFSQQGPPAEALGHLISAQARAGDVEGAFDTLRSLVPAEELGSQTGPTYYPGRVEWLRSGLGFALGDIAAAQVLAGDLEGALETAQIPHQQNVTPSIEGRIVAALAQTGEVDAALERLNGLASDDSMGSRIAGSDRDQALLAIVEAVAQAGDGDRALGIALRIKAKGIYRRAVSRIAVTQAGAGNIPDALDSLSVLEAEKSNSSNLQSVHLALGAAFLRAGDGDAAARHFHAAVSDKPRGGHHPVMVVRGFGHDAVARFRAGDVEGAVTLLAEALEYGRTTFDGRPYDIAAEHVAEVQALMGLPKEALVTALTIEKPWPRTLALSHVLEAFL